MQTYAQMLKRPEVTVEGLWPVLREMVAVPEFGFASSDGEAVRWGTRSERAAGLGAQ